MLHSLALTTSLSLYLWKSGKEEPIMHALGASSVPSFHGAFSLTETQFHEPKLLNFQISRKPISFSSRISTTTWKKSKLFTTISPSPSSVPTDPSPDDTTELESERFDWFAQWYPVMPVCDLDKRVPVAKRVMGLDVVVWWDRNENAWKVFDDSCPHRLAPLSEGRIDQQGRLQCVYHGWCFNGSGDCKLIPQAPPDGPPVHTFKKACVAVYPSTLHHDIVWMWPNTDPQYKNIIEKKKPPFIPELDDPSFTKLLGNREIPYGYDVMVENLMDPSHVPYAHYGIMRTRTPKVKVDREGGRPLQLSVGKVDKGGFIGKQDFGASKFIAPSIFYAYGQVNGTASSAGAKNKPSVQRRSALIFICVPVSPGYSRLIWALPRNFGIWIDKVFPRWIFHVTQNLILDSDLYLLHVEERKLREAGPENWEKTCFVPTKADAHVVGFRRWFNKYAGSQVDWRGKYSGDLPPTPPREQLMDRYWSHTVNCTSCSAAYKSLNAIEVALQVLSVAAIGIAAAFKQSVMSAVARTTLVAMAIVFFVGSKWLAHFIYKNFHYHDFNHAFR